MNLITWNTQWCRGLDGDVSPRRIVDTARALGDFDVLCLQEIAQGFENLPGRPGDQLEQLAAALPGYSLHFGAAVHNVAPDGRVQRFGNLVATRLPVAHVRHHPLPSPFDAVQDTMARMCTVVTLRCPQLGAVRVMTTHLEYRSSLQRRAQARAVRELHAEACGHAATRAQVQAQMQEAGGVLPWAPLLHTSSAVLCGDLNAPPDSPELEVLQSTSGSGRFRDAWPLVHGQAPHPATFCVHEQVYAPAPVTFDFVLVSDDLAARVDTMHVDSATTASDHPPVWVSLS